MCIRDRSKFGGYPSFYAAQAYDTILAIDHAVAKSGSKDTAKMREVLAAGGIPTTRGSLKMNSNHFPIQNFYLREAVKDSDGVVTSKIIDTVFEDHGEIVPDLGPTMNENDLISSSALKMSLSSPKSRF